MIFLQASDCSTHRPGNTGRLTALLVLIVGMAAPLQVFAKPGDLVSVELERTMTPSAIDAFIATLYEGYTAPDALYMVDVYWVRFMSVYPDGAEAIAQAQVFVPRFGTVRPEPRILYAFGPGSTGLTDACRPSREHVAGIRWGLYRAHVLSHVGQGVIGVIPDYLGFGDPDREQYYMVASAEAAAMLDSIRATKALLLEQAVPGISTTSNFVAGFSQGGHAAFAAADFRRAYAPDIKLAGVIGYGPSADLEALFREFPDVAPMVLYTFRNLYGVDSFDPDLALADKFAGSLDDDVTRQCVGGMQSYYPIDPKKLFKPSFAESLLAGTLDIKYPGIYKALKANTSGLAGHRVPVMICQGTDDIVVYASTQKAFAKALENEGSHVDLVIYEGVRHDTRQASFSDVQDWMESRLDK